MNNESIRKAADLLCEAHSSGKPCKPVRELLPQEKFTKIISFKSHDIDRFQEMVTRPLRNVDAWEVQYVQIERGVFVGSYVGAALPSDRTPFIKGGEEIRNSATELLEAFPREPAVHGSRQTFKRRLHVTGRAPKTFLAFLVPLGTKAALRQKGQTVEPGQFLALAPGEECDLVMASDTDFLSVRLHPENANAILSALDSFDDKLPSGVLTPDEAALRLFEDCFSRWLEPVNGTDPFSAAALKALEFDILESLTAALDVGTVSSVSPGLHRRRPIARLAREYLEANLDRPVAVTELCTVTGATVRTVHYAFKCYFGTSPAAYHKYRRLKFVHDDLRRAHPMEASVTEIGLAKGFWHLGRLSTDYKALFGETPSQTLHSHH